MSKEMKKAISKLLVFCMRFSAAYTTVTANALENEGVKCSESQVEQTEGYKVKFITNGFHVEYNGKEVADGETVISTKAPAVWVETHGAFLDRNGNEVSDNDINNPEIGPVTWVDNREEIHGEGDGYIKFTTDLGNPVFLFDGKYDHMGYYGNGVFDVKGISGDITIELRQNPNDIENKDLPDYSDPDEEDNGVIDHTMGVNLDNPAKSTAPANSDGVYSVKFITNGAHIECDGKEIADGDTVKSVNAPSVWVESKGYFVDCKGNKISEDEINDPEKAPVSWVDNFEEIHGDGDGKLSFHLTEGNPMFNIIGEYDWMGYSGQGIFEIIGISEDLTVEVTAPYGMDENNDDTKGESSVNPAKTAAPADNVNSDADTKKPSLNLLGDINGDNKATAKDSMLIQRYAVNLSELDETQKFLGDVDGNGKVTNADAMSILRYTVNENVKYSIGEEKTK